MTQVHYPLIGMLPGDAQLFKDTSHELCTRYFLDSAHTILHRVDGPAVEYTNSYLHEWYQHGQRHREDGPAIIWSNGSEEWWVKGQKHRVDGPAVIHADGREEWRINGKLHRLDGPAATQSDGTEHWFLYGDSHRLDGPAVVTKQKVFFFFTAPESKMWYLFGVPTNKRKAQRFIKEMVKEFGKKNLKDVPYEVLKQIFIAYEGLDVKVYG